MSGANPQRGEAQFEVGGKMLQLRPTFNALVCAEEELGPLLALVERAGEGQLRLAEIAALFWHCLADRTGIEREAVGRAVVQQGLAAATKPLRILLSEILRGSG